MTVDELIGRLITAKSEHGGDTQCGLVKPIVGGFSFIPFLMVCLQETTDDNAVKYGIPKVFISIE